MKKKTDKKNEKKLTWINDSFAIDGVNNYSDECTFFNLHVKSEIGDIVIYGCRVVSGSKGDFIAFPSKKVEDRYLNICWIQLSDDITAAIIDAVSDMI
ncbi:MAG: hypothetical protein J6Q39_06960 [Bacteroidales bacterium]|nr:hypothetical protein [Bacteroidales bacterium]